MKVGRRVKVRARWRQERAGSQGLVPDPVFARIWLRYEGHGDWVSQCQGHTDTHPSTDTHTDT